jgi:hypothetical protein
VKKISGEPVPSALPVEQRLIKREKAKKQD